MPITSDTANMGHAVDTVSKFDDSDSVIRILMVCELGVLNWLTESINLVDLFLGVWAAGGNPYEPTCRIYLVYPNVGEEPTTSGRETDKEACEDQIICD